MSKSRTGSCSHSSNEGMNLESKIPFDIIIEILTRVPAKSVARFLCLSKLLYSNLTSPNFKKQFLIISSSRPKLLFICVKDGNTSFFSSSINRNSSRSFPDLAADFHMSSPNNCYWEVSRPLNGLVCGLNQKILHGSIVTVPFLCNPSTGSYLTLPKVRTRKRKVHSFLGYDPIDKQFKVLCMIQRKIGFRLFQEHQVLTLETQEKICSWRMIECDTPHETFVVRGTERSVYEGICINGVLYYLAYFRAWHSNGIMSFDIRSERFKSIRGDEGMENNYATCIETTLVNYKGKLAMIQPQVVNYRIFNGIQLWILEDAEEHQWSSLSYIMTLPCENELVEGMLRFVGTTNRGAIILSSCNIFESYFLFCYDPERNSMRRVKVRGMEAFKSKKAYTFIDHVEDIKLLEC